MYNNVYVLTECFFFKMINKNKTHSNMYPF